MTEETKAARGIEMGGLACPANWTTGEDVIVPPPTTMDLAAERVADTSVTATDWYFAKKSI